MRYGLIDVSSWHVIFGFFTNYKSEIVSVVSSEDRWYGEHRKQLQSLAKSPKRLNWSSFKYVASLI